MLKAEGKAFQNYWWYSQCMHPQATGIGTKKKNAGQMVIICPTSDQNQVSAPWEKKGVVEGNHWKISSWSTHPHTHTHTHTHSLPLSHVISSSWWVEMDLSFPLFLPDFMTSTFEYIVQMVYVEYGWWLCVLCMQCYFSYTAANTTLNMHVHGLWNKNCSH